jgi:hypothetical protein
VGAVRVALAAVLAVVLAVVPAEAVAAEAAGLLRPEAAAADDAELRE